MTSLAPFTAVLSWYDAVQAHLTCSCNHECMYRVGPFKYLCLHASAEYLFPAANLMAKQKEDPNFSLALVPHAELYVALNARCSTKASRQVCTVTALKTLSQQHLAVLPLKSQ